MAIRWHFFASKCIPLWKSRCRCLQRDVTDVWWKKKENWNSPELECIDNSFSTAFVTCHFQNIRPVAYWNGPFTCRLLPALFTIRCELCRSSYLICTMSYSDLLLACIAIEGTRRKSLGIQKDLFPWTRFLYSSDSKYWCSFTYLGRRYSTIFQVTA